VIEYVNGEYFWDTRNPTEHPDRVTADILEQTYLVPTQEVTNRLPMQRHGWHEYGNYIGLASAALLFGALLGAFARRSASGYWFGFSLAVTTVFMFMLSLGEFSTFAPASLAHYVPLFSSFRIPSRYTIPFVQFAALTTGWLMQSGSGRTASWRAARLVLGVALLVTAGRLMVVNQWNLKNVFSLEPFETRFAWNAGPHHITTDAESGAYTPTSPMLRALVSNRSFFYCYESLQLLRGGAADKPPVFDPDADRVADVDFTPNRLTFAVTEGIGPAQVVLNQNWGPGWTSSAGTIQPPSKKELARITVPAGRYTFSFVPPGFYAGLAFLAIAAIATALVWRRRLSPIS